MTKRWQCLLEGSKKFFRKENSEKRESRNKRKSSVKGQFQGCFTCELEEEDGENDNLYLMPKSDTDFSFLIPPRESNLFVETDFQENKDEHEIGLVPSSSEQISALALNEGTLLEIDSLNVPSEPRQELKNSGGTILET
ncbi:hypothetical protein HAX54_041050, partial [Datura stramonium]|nr:hypothetical protein [Datura stramonium]